MVNRMEKFGVRQRCMEGEKQLIDLFLVSLHYEREVNFYIYEDDFKFLGVIDRKILLSKKTELSTDKEVRLKDICKRDMPSVILWSEGEDLVKELYDTFMGFQMEEAVVVDRENGVMVGIIDRREFLNEVMSVTPENDGEMLCYREFSHFYKLCRDNLNRYARNVNSQHGEDGILKAVFDRIGTTSKYAVEFGGWDGIYLSNIRELIVNGGFGGLFIEGDEERAEQLKNNYKDYPGVSCIEAYVGFRENTLDSILHANHAPEQIDLLSIDIDGYDYHVWDAVKDYRPRVVIIEYNPSVPNDIVMINPHVENIFTGSSAAALVELGRKKGYSLIAVTQTNLLFVVDEEYDKLEIWDNDLSILRPANRLSDGRYFQTYNKKIVFTGYNSYIWGKGEPFDKEGIELLFSNV